MFNTEPLLSAQAPPYAGNSGLDRIIATAQRSIEETLIAIADLLPKILLAVLIVVGGVAVAQRLNPYIQTATAYVDRTITSDLTQEMFPNARADSIVNGIVRAFISFYAVFIASSIVGFSELQRELNRILFYLPDLFGGLAIAVLSVGVGRIAGQRTAGGTLATDTDYATEIAIAVKASIIAVGTIVGLEMIGADLQVVYTLADGFAGAIGLGLTAALAILIGVVAGIALQDSEFLQRGS